MDVKWDFSDVAPFLKEVKESVKAECKRVGEEAVDYAIEHGSYQNITGRLRASNEYEASENGLTLRNTAPYASFVESKGKEVIDGAALYAERRLKEIFE